MRDKNIVSKATKRLAVKPSNRSHTKASTQVGKSFQESYEQLLERYNVSSASQLNSQLDKQNFYRDLEELVKTCPKDDNDGTTQSTASIINYNKDELVLINEGKSWANPYFKVGRVTRVGDNVCGCYPNGDKFSFKPTKSGVGIVGRWKGDFVDTVEHSQLKDYLEESSPFFGKPFNGGENPFFPTNRPNQTLEVSGDESEEDLEDDDSLVEESSTTLEVTCPRCGVKQIWASNGYCKSCGTFYGFPHANPSGYYDTNVPVTASVSKVPAPFQNGVGNLPSNFIGQTQLASCGKLTEYLQKLFSDSQQDIPSLVSRISNKLLEINGNSGNLTYEDYEKLQSVYSTLYSITEKDNGGIQG